MPFCVLMRLKEKRRWVIIYPESVVFNNASEVVEMLKNNIEVDVKVKCIETGITTEQRAEKGITYDTFTYHGEKRSNREQ